MISYFKAFDVWARRGEGRLVRYRCFEALPEGKFCVQSMDVYRQPFSEEQVRQSADQFLELLAEQSPGERAGLYNSPEEAIRAHDAEFGDNDDRLG